MGDGLATTGVKDELMEDGEHSGTVFEDEV